jgi:hypothetical protein
MWILAGWFALVLAYSIAAPFIFGPVRVPTGWAGFFQITLPILIAIVISHIWFVRR